MFLKVILSACVSYDYIALIIVPTRPDLQDQIHSNMKVHFTVYALPVLVVTQDLPTPLFHFSPPEMCCGFGYCQLLLAQFGSTPKWPLSCSMMYFTPDLSNNWLPQEDFFEIPILGFHFWAELLEKCLPRRESLPVILDVGMAGGLSLALAALSSRMVYQVWDSCLAHSATFKNALRECLIHHVGWLCVRC